MNHKKLKNLVAHCRKLGISSVKLTETEANESYSGVQEFQLAAVHAPAPKATRRKREVKPNEFQIPPRPTPEPLIPNTHPSEDEMLFYSTFQIDNN